jgi:hypothetical protein
MSDEKYSSIGIFHSTWKRFNERRASSRNTFDQVANDVLDKAEKYEAMMNNQESE